MAASSELEARMTAFNGFPPETLRFLHELRVNNRKDWV